jgi:hypothetical protein
MADLYDRILGTPGDIPIHQFSAGLVDLLTGGSTRNQVVNAWNLDTEAAAQLDTLIGEINGLPNLTAKLGYLREFDSVLLLAERGVKYATRNAFLTRFGQIAGHWD